MEGELDNRVRKGLDEFIEKLTAKNRDEITLIQLFGSAARGELTDDSDIDVLIVTRGNRLKLMDEIARIVSKSLLEYGRYISAKVYDEKQYNYLSSLETPFMENIKREGKMVWKRN